MTHDLAYSRPEPFRIDYGREIEHEIVVLQEVIDQIPSLNAQFPSRWLAIKLLEQDEQAVSQISRLEDGAVLLEANKRSIAHLTSIFDEEMDTMIADRRYGWINGLAKETVSENTPHRMLLSDRIDNIVTNRILGIPIFLFLMWLVFKFTTDLSTPLLDWVNNAIQGPVTRWLQFGILALNLGNTWVESLLLDGIVAGVGSLLAFIPVLMTLYLALAVLEDSGYMARAAFVMDRFMHVLGLHGKSFLPLIVGFGCSVPGIFATRTLENEKDRILTGMMVPFMSCGARLPVYVLIAAIFFPQNAGVMVFWMYVLGIAIAILAGLLLRSTVFRAKEQSPFVLELPPYRLPKPRAIWFHMWEHTSSFIKKAGSFILICSLIVWLLLAIPVGGQGEFANAAVHSSAFASVANALVPALKPAGFSSWETSGALISGLAAKEVIVSTLYQVYETDLENASQESTLNLGTDIGEIIAGFFTAVLDTIKSIPKLIGIDLFPPETTEVNNTIARSMQASFLQSSSGHGELAAFAFMVFVLIYTPCVATLAAIRKELGGKWMLLSAGGQLIIAWLVSTLIFQGGMVLGFG